MGKPTGFLEFGRETPERRPVPVRLRDWREVYEPADDAVTRHQAGRCMDCGIAFCHEGCPLGNLIPEWNDLVYRDDWSAAADRLHATNNFPEFTGRLCPAPCEGSCVLGINQDPVTIERVELEIAEHSQLVSRWRWLVLDPPGSLQLSNLREQDTAWSFTSGPNCPAVFFATAFQSSKWKKR